MPGLDDDQRSELERLQGSIAEEEPKLAAAFVEFNAAVRAAYERLLGLAAGYSRNRDEFEHLHSEIASAMMEFAGESGDDWQQGEEGQRYLEWMNLWIEAASNLTAIERPRELTAPDPPLSAVIAGLPREPGEAEAAGLSASPEATMESAPTESVAELDTRRYFEYTGGTSNKFWEVSREGSEMTTRYGKIGTGGQSKTKSFDSLEKAAAETDKIIAKKVREGYVEKKLPGSSVAPSHPGGGPRPAESAGWSGSADPEPMLGTALASASDRKRRLFAVACCRRVEDWLVVESGLVLDMRIEDYKLAVEAAEQFADAGATFEEMRNAFWCADDSAFCNLEVEDATADEMRKATYGDDAGWTARVREMSDEDRRELEALPDPAAWFEDEDHAGDLPAGVDPFRDVADEDAALVGETVGRQVLLLARTHGDREREAEERAAQAALIRDIFGDQYPPPSFDPAWRTPGVSSLAVNIYGEKAFESMPSLADALEEAGCDNRSILGHCRGPGPHVRGCWVLDLVLGKE